MSTTTYNLFQQETVQNSKWQGAPKLRPKGNSSVVNILEDYSWTASPKSARNEIPSIIFQEYELDLSSLISGMLYKLRGGIDNAAAFSNTIGDILRTSTDAVFNTKFVALASNTNNSVLNPYAGMYSTTPTGWSYIAPYLEELNQNITNRWGDDNPNNGFSGYGGNTLKNIQQVISKVIDTTNLANIAAPGSYAEKPKFFNPGDTDSYQIKFPLLNTLNYDDIVRNWELCYLLTYQNLPNRRSVNLLDPPSLYKVTIPGVRQSPIAYISKLSILNMGNIRNVEINGRTKPIPEAYMVSITFQDLLLNSRNIFKYALDGQQVVATVEPRNIAKTGGQ